MGFLDKIKNMVNAPDDDEYYDDAQDDISLGDTSSTYEKDDISSSYNTSYAPPSPSYSSERSTSGKSSRVVNINATTQLQVVLVKPERVADAPSIADHLNEKRTVVLNLESTSKDVSRRLVDFLSGVAYANKGQIKRVANSTFIITPYNVDIMGDMLIDELENNGMYV